jgi:PAS domain S-box-containing protein
MYLVAGAVVACCYFVVPPVAGNRWLFEVVGLSTAFAIGVGLRRHRPAPRLPWILFLVAQVVLVAADFSYYAFDLRFPSVADVFYLGYFPVQAVALVLLLKSRSAARDWDWASLLDVLIVTVSVGMIPWLFLIEPGTHDAGTSLGASLVSGAYPVMDALLLALTVNLRGRRGSRGSAFAFMMASVLALTVTDSAYMVLQSVGTYTDGSVLDLGWMASYLLFGAAALHPSMRELSAGTGESTRVTLTTKRILLLAGSVLVGPFALLFDSFRPVPGFDPEVAVAVSAVVFVLAVSRALGLVADLRDAIARHERAERRETILRHAASALTASPDREFVRLATMEGAVALVRDLDGAEVAVDLSTSARPSTTGRPGRHAGDGSHLVEVSLATRAAPFGRLVVSSPVPIPTDIADGLQTLGSQAGLALEAVSLAEDLHAQQAEARVAALVQTSSDMIMLVDADLLIRYVTPSVAGHLGHRPEDLVGTSATELADRADQGRIREFYTRLLDHPGRSVTAEWQMRRADGVLTDFEATVTNLLADPSVRGIVVTAHDITERKALETGLKRQVAELEEFDQIRSDFVATVSHELRTPLTNIIGEVELLEDGDRGDLTECQAQGVDVIHRNGRRLLALIEDLLTLSEIEERAIVVDAKPTPVATLVQDAGTKLAPVAAAKSVTLEIDYGPQVGLIVADPVQLDRVLQNLLSNAVKFTLPGGRAALRATRIGDEGEFRVTDSGVGIPEEEQVRLFTRFFRSSVATRLAIQGTGLGLVIVKRIVEAHGGTVTIASRSGVGTTVTVRLPAGGEGIVVGAA